MWFFKRRFRRSRLSVHRPNLLLLDPNHGLSKVVSPKHPDKESRRVLKPVLDVFFDLERTVQNPLGCFLHHLFAVLGVVVADEEELDVFEVVSGGVGFEFVGGEQGGLLRRKGGLGRRKRHSSRAAQSR